MSTTVGRRTTGLWGLVWGQPEVDPAALAEAVERELGRDRPDFRTRLLIRDSAEALESYWGQERWREWLRQSPARAQIEAIRREDLGETGFPALRERLVEKTDPETVKQFLRDLGTRVAGPVRLPVGGSIALILTGYLSRATEDIDVVDEVPAAVRAHRQLLDELARRYGLRLTHFQSHYLPAGWEGRLHSLGSFGGLQVLTVDVYDVFLSKLFSNRAKDLDDLRVLSPGLDKGTLAQRLQTTAASLLREPTLRPSAERNWYVLYGEPLPAGGPAP
jgi:hypothetical protein